MLDSFMSLYIEEYKKAPKKIVIQMNFKILDFKKNYIFREL
jgi:hypothetical protein